MRIVIRSVALFLGVSAAFLVLQGCNRTQQQWEITVENKSDVPSSFFITLGAGSGNVKIEDVDKGKVHSLIVGDRNTVVESIRVVRGKDEQNLNPKAELPVGKRYAIVVGTNGKVEGSVLGR